MIKCLGCVRLCEAAIRKGRLRPAAQLSEVFVGEMVKRLAENPSKMDQVPRRHAHGAVPYADRDPPVYGMRRPVAAGRMLRVACCASQECACCIRPD